MLTAQSMGGTECYPREPTAIEERLMVYLAFINGASGIMHFTHQDPFIMDEGGGADTHLRCTIRLLLLNWQLLAYCVRWHCM